VPEAGYDLKTLSVSGLKGKSKLSRFTALAKLPLAVAKSAYIVSTFGPHIALSGGGYAAWPACWTAAKLKVPLAVLEVNSLPGMVSKVLSKSARKAYITFEAAAEHLSCETMLTGNPLRSSLHELPDPPDGRKLSLLIIGGSQGAVGLNDLMIDALPHFKGMELMITHQAGARDRERVEQAYRQAGLHADVVEFIDDMPTAYARANVVISRAGATSVAEIIAAGRPAMLVPLPTAADDHQTMNAREIERLGGGVILPQKSTTGKDMAQYLRGWYDHRSKLEEMRSALLDAARQESARIIAEDLLNLAQKK
jgi:UDP-N-acetylglucosamine--N-acetylmuramyl-(pentapeptide) pyrophosphoryl-undecaprenol N-acetylglucosamine transferase